MAFDPKQHMTDLKGKDYLEVKWRLVWFREVHPKGIITTDVHILTDTLAITKATVKDVDGAILSQGTSTIRSGKGTAWAGREVEKSETSAIGRALAHAGFGTQFDPDSDEGDYLADSPIEPSGGSKKTPPKMSKTMPNSSADNAPPATIPYEQLQNRRKKVFEAVKPHFDENFGTYMKFCGHNNVDWNMKSDEIIQHIRKAIQ